jgi:hypothetical protein
MSRLFISYNDNDREFARRLTVDLFRLGVDVWFDEVECKIGDSLFEAVQGGIASSEYLGVVLSPSSISSPWVQKEVEAALAEEVRKKRVKILPLLLVDCEIPLFLAGRQYADFRNGAEYATTLEKLVERVGVHTSQAPPLLASDAQAGAQR